jgi:hypothetical protein
MLREREPELLVKTVRRRNTLLGPHCAPTTDRPPAYDPADSRYLADDCCFLCGTTLTADTRTSEHVFPKWLLNRFDLWDSEFNLQNGTAIRYRQIRVPCCSTCNGSYLSSLESRIEQALDAGYSVFRKLPQGTVFQWLAKIFYQVLYLETRLAHDRTVPKDGPILKPEFLEQLRVLHMLLNSVRIKTRLVGFPPWSIFVLPAQTSSKRERNFDFVDNVPLATIALRIGDTAILAALQDGHAQDLGYRNYFARIARRVRLHPFQFRELAVSLACKQLTMQRSPKYLFTTDARGINFVTLPVAGMSTLPVFGDWDHEAYARGISFFLGVPFEIAYQPPQMWSCLHDNGRYRHIDIDSVPPLED